MSAAPEPYLSACMEVLYRLTIKCRVWGWSVPRGVSGRPVQMFRWRWTTSVRSIVNRYLKNGMDSGYFHSSPLFALMPPTMGKMIATAARARRSGIPIRTKISTMLATA